MRKKAFIIGSNRDKLQYAESDAQKIKSGLESVGYLADGLGLAHRTADEILARLRDFLKDLGKVDSFIFYFAGHSFRHARDNVLLLAVNSSDLSRRETCISANVLLDLIQASNAGNKLVMLDSCESAGIFNSANQNQRNFTIITAAESWERSPEIEELRAGLMSHLFCKALAGKEQEALTRTATLTTNSLFDWMSEQADQFRKAHNAAIPRIIKGGSQNQPFPIASFADQMDIATQTTLHKLETLVDKADAVKLPESLANQLKFQRLQSKLAFEKDKLSILDEEVAILRKDYLLAINNLQKQQIERLIQAREEEIEMIIAGFQQIEAALKN